jgi:RimJ/RimL family protein N-acetyltransferase
MPADPQVLVGDGLRLLPVTADQVERVLAGDVPGLRPGRGWPHADTAPALDFLEAGGLTWLVVDDSGAVVGEVGTKGPAQAGTVEIGYGLAGPHRGRGLGFRAVATLVTRLQEQPDVTSVVAHVRAANEPSRRLLERLGFVVETTAPDGERRYRRGTPVDAAAPDLRW